MQFFSTRDHNRVVSASQAIAQGLSDEGGLFVPQSFPQVDVKAICALDYPEMAAAIVGQYLTDYSQEFLQEAAKATYGAAFGGKAGYLAPVSDEVYSLELWHGPTCAFKDYALQLMPKLLVEAKKNLDRTEKTLILVATSGDTGKAALDGYHDIPGVEIAVFFPTGGTSEIQRLQMVTQEGENVAVYEQFEDDTWLYQTRFCVQPRDGERLYFVSDGIDYRFEVWLDGERRLEHEGMFSRIELDLTENLKAEGNTLEVRILPHPSGGQPRGTGREEAARSCKPAVGYGWDWHPRLLSSGMWQEAWLETRDEGFIRDCEAR